jgi:hypothetical protein
VALVAGMGVLGVLPAGQALAAPKGAAAAIQARERVM